MPCCVQLAQRKHREAALLCRQFNEHLERCAGPDNSTIVHVAAMLGRVLLQAGLLPASEQVMRTVVARMRRMAEGQDGKGVRQGGSKTSGTVAGDYGHGARISGLDLMGAMHTLGLALQRQDK